MAQCPAHPVSGCPVKRWFLERPGAFYFGGLAVLALATVAFEIGADPGVSANPTWWESIAVQIPLLVMFGLYIERATARSDAHDLKRDDLMRTWIDQRDEVFGERIAALSLQEAERHTALKSSLEGLSRLIEANVARVRG